MTDISMNRERLLSPGQISAQVTQAMQDCRVEINDALRRSTPKMALMLQSSPRSLEARAKVKTESDATENDLVSDLALALDIKLEPDEDVVEDDEDEDTQYDDDSDDQDDESTTDDPIGNEEEIENAEYVFMAGQTPIYASEDLGQAFSEKIRRPHSLPELTHLPHDIRAVPHKHQSIGVNKMLHLCVSELKGAILGDEMGLGKTHIVVGSEPIFSPR